MESPTQQFRTLLLEVAPLLESAQAVLRQDNATWVMVFADELLVEVHVDERLRKVVLSTLVGRPEDELCASTYQVLFIVNGLWRETGGLRFGLDAPDGEIEQCLDLNLDHLSVQKLVAIMEDFTARAGVWQALIEDRGGLDLEAVQEHETTLGANILRV